MEFQCRLPFLNGVNANCEVGCAIRLLKYDDRDRANHILITSKVKHNLVL